MFFDPDADTPQEIDPEKVTKLMTEAMAAAGLDPALTTAASLYEAAVLGLKAFRSSSFAEHSLPGTNTRLKVTVRSEEATHEAAVAQVETWLRGQGKSPREQALKVRLRTEPGG